MNSLIFGGSVILIVIGLVLINSYINDENWDDEDDE